MKQDYVLNEVLHYMMENSFDGIFHGSPRSKMEEIGVSSGPLYHQLKSLGIRRIGRGQKAKWIIPLEVFTKRYK
jgi:hypothetical protein